MGLVANGHKIFEVISRYDDLLALEGKEDYEPGDTLKLIIPFLLYHGISEEDIRKVSDRAGLVRGAAELIAELKARGWKIYIISTSYEQHAYDIGKRVGVPKEGVSCTLFPLDDLRQVLKGEELSLLAERERFILSELYGEELGEGEKDHLIKPYLDRFYWRELPGTGAGRAIEKVRVLGGRRKVWAMERIVRELEVYLEDICFVGDSITDAQGARMIESVGGLAVAFNGNAFVVPYATVGLATVDLLHLAPILEAWQKGGRAKVKAQVEEMLEPASEEGPHYHWLVGRSEREMEGILAIHRRLRGVVREEAGKLG